MWGNDGGETYDLFANTFIASLISNPRWEYYTHAEYCLRIIAFIVWSYRVARGILLRKSIRTNSQPHPHTREFRLSARVFWWLCALFHHLDGKLRRATGSYVNREIQATPANKIREECKTAKQNVVGATHSTDAFDSVSRFRTEPYEPARKFP